MSAATKMEGRQTRARSKEIDAVSTSPNKKPGRPRRGRSASVEQQAIENVQQPQAQPNFNAQPLGIIPEEIDENMMAVYKSAHPGAESNNAMPMTNLPPSLPYGPEFPSAQLEAAKNLRARKGAKNQRQPAAQATAPEAPMLQQMAQHAQHANQMHPQMDQQLAMLDPQLENPPQGDIKRSLFDRQQGAIRVNFDDSQPNQMQPPIAPQAEISEAGTTQDDGFQTDTRSLGNVPLKRRGRAPRQQPVPEGDSNYEQPSSGQAERELSPRPSPPRSNYAEVQQQAKLYTATLRRDKVPQKRKAWTSEECDALIDGIGQYGNGYATLKAEDSKHRDFLHDRSAEDLRHKARNMKFDYLKAGVTLPPGFDAVLLDKKFKDKLAAMGRSYTQMQMRQPKRQKTKHVPDQSQEAQEGDHSQVAEQ